MRWLENLTLCVILVILSFLGGVKYEEKRVNSMLSSVRADDMGREGVPQKNAIQSINEDLRRMSEERELLKTHLEVNVRYLERNDIDGLRRWTSKMKDELFKEK